MSRKSQHIQIDNIKFYEKEGYCASCIHAVERHYDKHRTKKRNKYELVCLLTAKPVSKRGWPKTLNSEIYPCRYIGSHDGYIEKGE